MVLKSLLLFLPLQPPIVGAHGDSQFTGDRTYWHRRKTALASNSAFFAPFIHRYCRFPEALVWTFF